MRKLVKFRQMSSQIQRIIEADQGRTLQNANNFMIGAETGAFFVKSAILNFFIEENTYFFFFETQQIATKHIFHVQNLKINNGFG